MRRFHISVIFAALLLTSASPAWAQCSSSATNAGYAWISVPENPAAPLPPFQGGMMNVGIWYPTSSTPSSYTYNSGDNTLNLNLQGCVALNGAVATGAKYPVLLFSHGDGGCGTQSVFLTEQAARQGYIVIAPDSADATCSVTGVPYTNPNPPPSNPSFAEPYLWTPQDEINRLYDMENSLIAVHALARYAPYMDLTHIAISGHSLGGYTSFAILGGWPSWQSHWQTTMTNAGISQAIPKLALLYSPFIQAFMYPKSILTQVTAPIMFQGGTLDTLITPYIMGVGGDSYDTGAFSLANSPKMFMELDQAGHLAFTNLVCVALPVQSCLTNEPNAALIDNYTFAFLSYYLNNQPAPMLWSAPAATSNRGPANWWRITPASSVSDASFSATAPLAASEISAMFGAGLASTTAIDSTAPTSLGSVKISVTDSGNVTRQAPISYVSSGQINYVVPNSTAVGTATISVSDSSGAVTNSANATYPGNPAIQGDIVASGTIQISGASPSLFTEGGSVAAAYLFTLHNGATTYSNVFQCSSNTCTTMPLSLGASGDTAWLELYGTGIRNASGTSVNVGGQTLTPIYAGISPSYTGLDQVDVIIPPSFAGRGTVAVSVSAPGVAASNSVTVTFR